MSYLPVSLREMVWERASGCCEYCLLPQSDDFFKHEVDHIVARKHGGQDSEDNLCLSCFECNRHKGSDLSSVDPESGEVVRLFDPRQDNWNDHFNLENAYVAPQTAKARATVTLLKMNDPARIQERERLIRLNRYPPHLLKK